jgi:ABC-2 type transport system permease protein
MAVYERSYRPFEGGLTPKETRFLVLPRYAYQQVFQSKLFVAFIGIWFLWPLVLAFCIYLPNNLSILEKLGTTSQEISLFPMFHQDAAWFFWAFMVPVGVVIFVIALIVGPGLISPDMRNNGLPLYLSRPFSRTEYILGKVSILTMLMSAVSWIPGVLLFLLKAYFGGFSWFKENYRIVIGIFLGSWIWILILVLLSLALSAFLKWKPIAGMAMLAIYFISPLLSGLLNVTLKTTWASLLNISDMIRVVWASLFGIESPVDIPAFAAWLSLLTLCALCVLLLYRKVRAYEIVR